jgi:hypothetical protein
MADIQHAVQIDARPEAIHPLFASAEGLGKWWATDITEQEGTVDLGFFNRSTIYRLRPGKQNPPAGAEWRCESGDQWNGTYLRFVVEPAKTGSLLRFTHGGWREPTDYFTMCNTTWGELMYRLKAAAEGKASGPLFSREGMGYGAP